MENINKTIRDYPRYKVSPYAPGKKMDPILNEEAITKLLGKTGGVTAKMLLYIAIHRSNSSYGIMLYHHELTKVLNVTMKTVYRTIRELLEHNVIAKGFVPEYYHINNSVIKVMWQ